MFKFLSIFRYYFTLHGLSVTHFSVTLSRLSAVRLIATFNTAGLEFAMSVCMMMQICGLYCCVVEPNGTAVHPRRIVFCREFIVTTFAIADRLVTFLRICEHTISFSFCFQFSFFIWRRVITNDFGLNVVEFHVRTIKYQTFLHNCSAATGWTAKFQEIEIPKYLIAIILDRTDSPHYFYV